MTLTISPSPGPTDAPAARAGVGFDGPVCLRYAFSPTSDGPNRVLIEAADRVLEEDDRLEYVILPALSGRVTTPESGLAACAANLDLLFDDGTRLSELRATTEQGVELTPEAVAASLTLLPDQWNLIRVPLRRFAGRRVTGIELVAAAIDAVPFEGWVDAIHIRSTPAIVSSSPVDDVNPLRGTHSARDHSRGNTIPAVAVPNAFHLVTPVTDATDPSWIYTYQRDVDNDAMPGLEAFAVSHLASPWLGERGALHLFPLPGDEAGENAHARRLAFHRDQERATPYLYDVTFVDGTRARATATSRTAIFELTYPHDGPARLVLEFPGADSAFLPVRRGDTQVQGWTNQPGHLPAGTSRCFYTVHLSRPVEDARPARSTTGGASLSLTLQAARSGTPVVVSVGSSWIDLDQASRNHRRELGPDRSIDDVAENSRRVWNDLLSQFSVQGARDDERRTFYSCLYRMFLYPNVAHEYDGGRRIHRVPGPADDVRLGPLTVNNGFWDTYRTTWPAYALFAPERSAMLLNGVLQHAVDTGWIPRWTAPGPVDLMVGTSADIVLAEAIVKGVPLADPLATFDAVLRSATAVSPDPAVGRKGIAEGRFRGYISTEVPEGLSWTLENAVSDAAITAMTATLLDELRSDHPRRRELEDAREYFHHRARQYAICFDSDSGWFRGRSSDGLFSPEPFDPAVWGGDYTETNAWGMAFSVPHDPEGLATLLGGRDRLREHLDAFFRTQETAAPEHVGSYGQIIHEMTEARDIRMGMFGLSNQPAHHIPFLYAYTDTPHRTQQITREALRRCFLGGDIGQGYPGDEDNGELSAWYVFAALGLYPLAPWARSYVLTAPLFDDVEIRLSDTRTLRIVAHERAPGHNYIQAVRVNGQPWDSPFLPHRVVASGAVIEYTLGPEPSAWGAGAPGPSLTARGETLVLRRDCSAPTRYDGPRELIDDLGHTDIHVQAGDVLEWWHEQPTRLEQYSFSSGKSPADAPTSWRWEARSDEHSWSTVDERSEVSFTWPDQLRPFGFAARIPAYAHRVVFTSSGSLTQIELLADHPYTSQQDRI